MSADLIILKTYLILLPVLRSYFRPNLSSNNHTNDMPKTNGIGFAVAIEVISEPMTIMPGAADLFLVDFFIGLPLLLNRV